MQDIRQAVPSSADSAAQDATVAQDTTSAVGEMGTEMGEAVDMIAAGDLSAAQDQIALFFSGFMQNVVPGIIKGALVFVLLLIVWKIFRAILSKILRSSKLVDAGLENLLMKTTTIVAWAFISVMVLAQFGVDITALLAGLSIIGLAVGLAARDSLENFISGVTIMIDRPFRVGDQVVVEGTYGTVEEITLRSTRLRTLNNEVMVMPNVLMINQKLINHTLLGILRIEVPFGIAYKESTDAARSVVLRLLSSDSRIATDYPVEAVVTQLGESSVDMVLRFYVRNSALEVPMKAEYTEQIFKALKAAKIEIPFPHLQLFIDEAKGLLPAGSQSSTSPPPMEGQPVAWRPL